MICFLLLKDLNNELSRKLEQQTQRLELLTAQNMANENISIRQPDSATTHDHTVYADEGDEVPSFSLMHTDTHKWKLDSHLSTIAVIILLILEFIMFYYSIE